MESSPSKTDRNYRSADRGGARPARSITLLDGPPYWGAGTPRIAAREDAQTSSGNVPIPISGVDHGRATTKHIFLRDSPYHFFIDAAGHVAEGRALRFAAYSNTTYLTPIEQHITVAVEGDLNKAQPTDAQMGSLVELLALLAKRHAVKLANIGYHQNVVAQRSRADGSVQYGTDCPGKYLIARFVALRSELQRKGIE